MLPHARAFLAAYGRRRRRNRPKAFPVSFVTNEGEVTHFVALDEYPLTIMLPILDEPGLLAGRDAHHGFPRFDEPGRVWIWQAAGHEDRAARLIEQFCAIRINVGHHLLINEFARFIAKIAHTYMIYETGVGAIPPFLTQIIRAPRNDGIIAAAHFIGTAHNEDGSLLCVDPAPQMHTLRMFPHDLTFGRVIIVQVQLFAHIRAPVYEVAVGGWI
jgi:hypothetical protein